MMHQPDAVCHTYIFTHTHTQTYRSQSPLAFRGQAKTRNIKVRVEEGKIGAKTGREGKKERKMQSSLPPMSLPLFLWSEAEADKLGSRQLHSMVNIPSLFLALPLADQKDRQGECVNCSQGHGITYPEGDAS